MKTVHKKTEKVNLVCNCNGDNCDCERKAMWKGKLIGVFAFVMGVSILFAQFQLLNIGKNNQMRGKSFSNTLLMTDKNICDNLKKIERFAERGNVELQMKLFELYGTQCATLPNASLKKGMWIMKAAWTEDYAPAQFKLSLLYEFGEGMPRNYREAIKWLKVSAEQNYPLAEYELAKRYRDGSEFLTADDIQYVYWLERSARHGFEQGASELASLYEMGDLVEQNLVEAYKWYSLASYVDYKKLNALETLMSTENIEEAQRKAIVLQKEIFKFVTLNPQLF